MSAQTGWTLSGRTYLRRRRKTVQLVRVNRHLCSLADSSHRSMFLRRTTHALGSECCVLEALEIPSQQAEWLISLFSCCSGSLGKKYRQFVATRQQRSVREAFVAKFPCVAVLVRRWERQEHRGSSHGKPMDTLTAARLAFLGVSGTVSTCESILAFSALP